MYFDFDEPKAPTGSTFKDMPMEPAVDNHGLIEVYRQIMLIDLFQTQFGGWITNQPVHIKLLMALLLLILLAVIAFGFYKAYSLNMDKLRQISGLVNKGKKQMDVLISKVKTQMKELFETFSTYFSHEAPVKVKTVKDGTRAHEFHED